MYFGCLYSAVALIRLSSLAGFIMTIIITIRAEGQVHLALFSLELQGKLVYGLVIPSEVKLVIQFNRVTLWQLGFFQM